MVQRGSYQITLSSERALEEEMECTMEKLLGRLYHLEVEWDQVQEKLKLNLMTIRLANLIKMIEVDKNKE